MYDTNRTHIDVDILTLLYWDTLPMQIRTDSNKCRQSLLTSLRIMLRPRRSMHPLLKNDRTPSHYLSCEDDD
jgi:hypothetical protein